MDEAGEMDDGAARRFGRPLSRSIPTALSIVLLGYFVVLGAYWVPFAILDQADEGHTLAAFGFGVAAVVLAVSVPLARSLVLRVRPTWRRPALLVGMTTGACVGFVVSVAAFVAIGSPWDW